MKKHLWIPQVICIVMLLWALNPYNPYSYYTLLRWVCCGVFAYLAFQSFEQQKQGWVWILGITALLYNPIFRVHLNREVWSVVNVVTIIIAGASIFAFKKRGGIMKKCPYCAEEIQDDAIKCKHCGEWLEKKRESIVLEKNVTSSLSDTQNLSLSNDKSNEQNIEPDSSSSDNVKIVEGKKYILQKGKEGEAFCLGCGSVDAVKNLYYCRESDEYYHEKCLSEGRKDIKEKKKKTETTNSNFNRFMIVVISGYSLFVLLYLLDTIQGNIKDIILMIWAIMIVLNAILFWVYLWRCAKIVEKRPLHYIALVLVIPIFGGIVAYSMLKSHYDKLYQ